MSRVTCRDRGRTGSASQESRVVSWDFFTGVEIDKQSLLRRQPFPATAQASGDTVAVPFSHCLGRPFRAALSR